jgi:surface antigen
MSRASLGVIATLIVLAGCRASGLVPTEPVAYAPADDGTVGLLGTAIGTGVSDADRKIGLNAEYRALEKNDPGIAVDWRGRNGSAGVVVPGTRYRVNDSDCRLFTHTVSVGEVTESATATACRTREGAWRIVG